MADQANRDTRHSRPRPMHRRRPPGEGSEVVIDRELLAELDREESGVAIADLDLPAWRKEREWFGLLRDRRPDLYGKLVEK